MNDDNKTLREQVAEVIGKRIADGVMCIKPGGEANLQLADAAIQAVKEGMRCGTCKRWADPQVVPDAEKRVGMCQYRVELWVEDDGCTKWEENDE